MVTRESSFIEMMRGIASSPAARGLMDDAAVLDLAMLDLGSETLILTHDMMVQGVHWLADGDAADVAWKLVAVNLSDLAAKGARPLGVLLGFTLGEDEWDRKFASGLRDVLREYDVPLLGGDTVMGDAKSRSIGMTAIGSASHKPVPSRSGAKAGDALYVTGTIGDALAGFEFAEAGLDAPEHLARAFHRPIPLLQSGQKLASFVTAMMDVSDGLLLDSSRMAQASGLALTLDLAAIPLSDDYREIRGDSRESRIQAASWGDDYQLLFAAPSDLPPPVPASKIGEFSVGHGLILFDDNLAINLPSSLGFEHH
jgi:thiamine-monophosphate kinase